MRERARGADGGRTLLQLAVNFERIVSRPDALRDLDISRVVSAGRLPGPGAQAAPLSRFTASR